MVSIPVHVIGIDTALVNVGVVTIRASGEFCSAGKPWPKDEVREVDEDSLFQTYDRIRDATDWIWDRILEYTSRGDVFVAIEDYLLTGYQRSYKTAELNSAIKDRLYSKKIPYCLVHPGRTKKYTGNSKASKTDIINYVNDPEKGDPKVLANVARGDRSDIADAWCVAKVGQLVWQYHNAAIKPVFPQHIKEFMFGDSGLLTKPGLTKISY